MENGDRSKNSRADLIVNINVNSIAGVDGEVLSEDGLIRNYILHDDLTADNPIVMRVGDQVVRQFQKIKICYAGIESPRKS